MEKTKQERINAEEKGLRSVYRKIGPKKKKVIEGLVQRAAYMRVTLEDFEADLDGGGYVEMFSQSENQSPYERERPVARLYNTMNKNYQSIIKQLSDCVVEVPPAPKDANDSFNAFVNGRDDAG